MNDHPPSLDQPDRPNRHPVEQLFELLARFGDYPPGVMAVPARIRGTAFFPGGAGLWGTVPRAPLPPLPVGGVMVLGHNFDSETGFARSLARQSENLNGPTWRTLRTVLPQLGIPLACCFFTNAYLGLKAGSKATGLFPGAQDADFVRRCRAFLQQQLVAQQPRLVLTLGQAVPPILAPLAPELDRAWSEAHTLQDMDARGAALVGPVQFPDLPHPVAVVALTHPAHRGPNVTRRRYQSWQGHTAEVALVQAALQHLGPPGSRAAGDHPTDTSLRMFTCPTTDVAARA